MSSDEAQPAHDPGRFQPYRETMTATLMRTVGIALVIASIMTLLRLHHLPANSRQWFAWLALAMATGWITLGGHFVELAYLNALRPRIAQWSDAMLVLVRIGVWFVGGTILFIAAAVTQNLLVSGEMPATSQLAKALQWGGVIFVLVELVPHAFLQLTGRPSFWNGRG